MRPHGVDEGVFATWVKNLLPRLFEENRLEVVRTETGQWSPMGVVLPAILILYPGSRKTPVNHNRWMFLPSVHTLDPCGGGIPVEPGQSMGEIKAGLMRGFTGVRMEISVAVECGIHWVAHGRLTRL